MQHDRSVIYIGFVCNKTGIAVAVSFQTTVSSRIPCLASLTYCFVSRLTTEVHKRSSGYGRVSQSICGNPKSLPLVVHCLRRCPRHYRLHSEPCHHSSLPPTLMRQLPSHWQVNRPCRSQMGSARPSMQTKTSHSYSTRLFTIQSQTLMHRHPFAIRCLHYPLQIRRYRTSFNSSLCS